MSNETLYVTVDKEAFLSAVKVYLDLSPVTKEWADVKNLKWPSALLPPDLWVTIREVSEMVSVTCAAVECAKQDIIKQNDPDGSKGAKFDREIALATAVQILSTLIKFNGWLGAIVNKIWQPLLNLLVSMYVNQQRNQDWVALAIKILAIVVK